MADKETNHYLRALESARTRIGQERDAFTGLDPLRHVTRAVSTEGGWDCAEADRWVEELTFQLTGLREAFEQAYDDIDARCQVQATEPEVDADDWRGAAYLRSQGSTVPMAV